MDFKSQIRQVKEDLARKHGKAPNEELKRIKSEEKFQSAKPKRDMGHLEAIEKIWRELDKLSKYDIKEVDRLGMFARNARNGHRQSADQVRSKKHQSVPAARGVRRKSQGRIPQNPDDTGEAETNHRVSARAGSASESSGLLCLGLRSEIEQFDKVSAEVQVQSAYFGGWNNEKSRITRSMSSEAPFVIWGVRSEGTTSVWFALGLCLQI